MAIGNVIHRVVYEINSFYNDDCSSSFFDFIFSDVVNETQENEEETQKNLSADLFCKYEVAHTITCGFETEQKVYLTLSAFFATGFYFSLIQPPD